MRERNRFSTLLKQLMTTAQVKNYTLAKELQYDESYISKWVNGNLLPTEKNHEKIIRDISHCLVMNLDATGWDTLMQSFQLTRRSDLEKALYDNLLAEYQYCLDLKDSTGSEVAQRINVYPELSLAQFMSKMHHPTLRQVRSLDVIAAMDIFALDRQYQLALAQLNADPSVSSLNYPNVRFSLLLCLDRQGKKDDYNAMFLLNLLANLADISFQLYICPQAVGKLVLAAKDAYSISGMIIDETHCMAVTTSEDVRICNAIYDRLKSLCSVEEQFLRKTTMEDMITSNVYTQYLLARNQRWILGHLTEHFVPDDLFDELVQAYCQGNPLANVDDLYRSHRLTQTIIGSLPIQVMIYEDFLTLFAISGELDFFNRKLTLSLEQRLKCLQSISAWVRRNSQVEVRLARSGSVTRSIHSTNPTVFLSDSVCYLRLVRSGTWNLVGVITQSMPSDMLRDFFDHTWADQSASSSYTPSALEDMIQYVIRMVNVQRNLANEA